MTDALSWQVALKDEAIGKEVLARIEKRDGQFTLAILGEDPKAEGRRLRSGVEAILRRYDSRADLRAALRRLLDEGTAP